MNTPAPPDRPDGASALPPHIEEGIHSIAQLHADHERRASGIQRTLTAMRRHIARPLFIAEVTVVVTVWILFNLAVAAAGAPPLDPPPFNGLQVALALAAVYITALILASQTHDDLIASRREQLTLELAVLSEQKSAKIISLLEELRRDHPQLRDRIDPVAAAMAHPADPVLVLAALTERTDTSVAAAAEGEEEDLQPSLF